VSGIVVGILKEQHSDHIVLGDASRVSFPDGLVLAHLRAGSSVTILFTLDDAGDKVVQSITQSATAHLPQVPRSPATDHGRWGYTNAGWR
jgi:hypothetical protein